MRTVLATHTELYREDQYTRDAPHTPEGLKRLPVLVESALTFIAANDQSSKGLDRLFMGDGQRYEDVFEEFWKQGSFEYAPFLDDPAPERQAGVAGWLGGAASRRSKSKMVYSRGGRKLYRQHCRLLPDYICPGLAWGLVEQEESETKGWIGLCGGRQFLTALGFKDEFEIASLYLLDWATRTIRCIIRNGVMMACLKCSDVIADLRVGKSCTCGAQTRMRKKRKSAQKG